MGPVHQELPGCYWLERLLQIQHLWELDHRLDSRTGSKERFGAQNDCVKTSFGVFYSQDVFKNQRQKQTGILKMPKSEYDFQPTAPEAREQRLLTREAAC